MTTSPPSAVQSRLRSANLFVTFEGLITRTPFVKQLQVILKTLQEKMSSPVDIEFAYDGRHSTCCSAGRRVYRRQRSIADSAGRRRGTYHVLRQSLRLERRVPDITHIVYVDPDKYGAAGQAARSCSQSAGSWARLNSLLPKRQFILMGPGAGAAAATSSSACTSPTRTSTTRRLLIEIARKKGNYVPELSFGTHFFQDLVESSIRYLPLYPDDPGIEFNEKFLLGSRNVLPDILPESASLADTVHVIDVPSVTGDKVLRVAMNADLGEALGFIATPTSATSDSLERKEPSETASEDHWHWRLRMAERIASQLDGERFGVKALYVFGSTKNATAGPGSDIDLLIHFRGSDEQRRQLILWLEGWSLCLAEINFSRTGHQANGLIDYHLLTDEDIADKTSYAVKIGAVTDAARPLPLKND